MPRELREAPAMAPTASDATSSFKSMLGFLKKHDLEAKVIAAWALWFILRHLQSILGPRRRRSGHWSVQYGAMAAYYLPTLALFYTANAIYSSDSDIKVGLSLGCLFLLIASARGAVTMTAFTLGDGPLKLHSWQLLPWILYFAWLQWGLIWWDRKLTVSDLYFFLVVCVAPVLYVLLAKPRAANLEYETKEFADHMMRERESRSSSPSPFFNDDENRSLYDRCRYPFKLRDGQWIDFSDVLQQRRQRSQLTGDPDVCLSYTFCRLLARRYFGFPCAEDGNAQVREFVLTELLPDINNKAFTIVEVQLALLHDYFFTNYHSKITSGVLSVPQGIVLTVYLLLWYLVGCVLVLVGYLFLGRVRDVLNPRSLIVSAVLGVLCTVVYQPQFPVLPTYWHPIRNLFLHYPTNTGSSGPSHSVNEQSAPPRRLGSGISYWRDKMGQYSVMEDYARRSRKKAFIAWCKVHVLSQVSYSFIKHHPVEEEDVSVPDSLKRFLASTIMDINGSPTIGTRSLVRNGLDDMSWTCRQETLTHTILIWHIATSYCDMSQPLEEETMPQSLEEGTAEQLVERSATNRNNANALSRYCAYLVAFLPELLPEHNLTVKVVFQQVLQEPKYLLVARTRMCMEEKRTKIQQLQLPEDVAGMNTFQKGVRLGQQLETKSYVLRWTAMADFWAEMIVYIASSSDNAAAHFELLAQGGEFVTHLWALLCNAGIPQPRNGAA